MNNDSGYEAVLSELSQLTSHLPPGSLLPSTRQLQQRFRASSLTVQRAFATLAARGLLVTRPGRGSYTTAHRGSARGGDIAWQTLALGSGESLPAGLEEMLAPAAPGLHPLSSAFLEEALQPLGLLAQAAARAARRPYGWSRPPAEGLEELRAHFAAEAGASYRAGDVIVTPGGQAALAAVCRHLGAPGEPIVVESPTYLGALAVARSAGLVAVPVPSDTHGVLPDALAAALERSRARLVYLQPRHANPTGAVLSAERRPAVLEAVSRAGAFLIEDDWVRDLDLERPGAASPAPLASIDDDGHVVYVRSLTKPVAPGLRIAGLVARGPALVRLRRGRVTDDLFVAPILQHTAVEVLRAPGWPRHLAGLRRALRLRRDTLVASIATSLPGCELYLRPSGGVHLWLRLPDAANAQDLAAAAVRQGVTVSPGHAYFPAEPPGEYLRLSYAAAPPPALERAVALLAAALETTSH
ncbi:MAG: aminotransferase-like domain-containing protein [Acidimicrobiales bacterium]